MSYNNLRNGNKTIGGKRPISTGRRWVLKHSGFALPLENVPLASEGFLPAGMPLVCNESNHTATPLKIAKVVKVSGKVVSIALNDEFSLYPFLAGESIIKLGATLTTAGTASVIDAVAISADGANTELTLSKAIDGLAVNDYIMLSNADGSALGEPNAILAFPIYKDIDAVAVFGNAAIKLTDGEIYERRIPEMPVLVKTALLNNGCSFTFSKSL